MRELRSDMYTSRLISWRSATASDSLLASECLLGAARARTAASIQAVRVLQQMQLCIEMLTLPQQ